MIQSGGYQFEGLDPLYEGVMFPVSYLICVLIDENAKKFKTTADFSYGRSVQCRFESVFKECRCFAAQMSGLLFVMATIWSYIYQSKEISM